MLKNVTWGALFSALLTFGASQATAQTYRTFFNARQPRGEEDLKVVVRFGIGTFTLGRDRSGVLYRSSLVYDADNFEPLAQYDPETRTLRIGIEGNDVDLDDRRLPRDQRMELEVSPDVPLSFDIEFGAGRAEIDLGGLALESAELKTGASEAYLSFGSPNLRECKSLSLMVGAAEFAATGLGNARCQTIHFSAGAGDFTLDFTGEWLSGHETTAEINVGFAALTLRFPSDLGVAVKEKRFLASFDHSGFVKRGDVYYSSNYGSADATLMLDLKAVIGDIDVVWVPD